MAHVEPAKPLNQDETQLGDLAGRLIRWGLLLAVLGLGVGCYLGFGRGGEAAGAGGAGGAAEHKTIFFHAYLVGFIFFLGITLGAIFFVILHHLARSGWSVTTRRLAEGLAGNIYLMLLLAVPLLFGLKELYEWIAMTPAEIHTDHILSGKSGYLNQQAMLIRLAIYFGVWIFLVSFFRSQSIKQDQSGDHKLSKLMEKVSAPGMIALGLTLSFAIFDLVMSMNPHWFSTIFGVYFFAGAMLSFLVTITLLGMWLQRAGKMRHAISLEHYHDLGKLTFAFTFFWGYIAFSQYMLIWYANMPEETQFFIPRQFGAWATIGIVLCVCHLAIPFAGLLSRHAKRKLGVFTFWAVWLMLAHLLDIFWLIMPNLFIKEIPAEVAHVTGEHGLTLPEALHQVVVSNQQIYQVAPRFTELNHLISLPLEPVNVLQVASLVIGMGGLYLVSTALMLQKASLVPLKDPRLPESLAFENI